MNDKRLVEEIVTMFLVDTCRLCPHLSQPVVQAAVHCGLIADHRRVDDVNADLIHLTTGSVAEFNKIEPMIPHIGDIDVMFHWSTDLAIPAGYPPPTQLPDEFRSYVDVCEIVDSHLPGYVYMVLRYSLTECTDDGKYNAVHGDRSDRLFIKP